MFNKTVVNYINELDKKSQFKQWVVYNNLNLEAIVFKALIGQFKIIHLWDAFHGKQSDSNISLNILRNNFVRVSV